MSEKPSTQAMLNEMEAIRFLARKKPKSTSVAGKIVALTIAAAFGWTAASVVHDRKSSTYGFYQPDASPPIGNRLIDGPALVRTGGILLLSHDSECPMGSTQLSEVAVQVIKQRAEQFKITDRNGADAQGWTGRTYKTCKI